MKSSWRSPDGGSSVARNTKIEPCGAVFCAWWGTGSTPIRSFHTVSLRGWVNSGGGSAVYRVTSTGGTIPNERSYNDGLRRCEGRLRLLRRVEGQRLRHHALVGRR